MNYGMSAVTTKPPAAHLGGVGVFTEPAVFVRAVATGESPSKGQERKKGWEDLSFL